MRGAKGRLVGVASIFLFDANGALNMGLQKRPFLFTDKVPFSWNPAAPPSGKQPGEDGVWCGSGGSSVGSGGEGGKRLWGGDAGGGVVSKDDWGFALERVRTSAIFGLGRDDSLDLCHVTRSKQSAHARRVAEK